MPWVLDLGDHREIAGNAVTPLSKSRTNEARFAAAVELRGSFCAATHYWELAAPSLDPAEPRVGEQLRILIERARTSPQVEWRSVGEVVCGSTEGVL